MSGAAQQSTRRCARMAAVAVAVAVRRAHIRARQRTHAANEPARPLWLGSPLVVSDTTVYRPSPSEVPALPLFRTSISKEAYDLLCSCATIKFDEADDAPGAGDAQCSICLSAFCTGERLKSPACGHRFHGRCIRAWFNKSHSECPVCRYDCRQAIDDGVCEEVAQ